MKDHGFDIFSGLDVMFGWWTRRKQSREREAELNRQSMAALIASDAKYQAGRKLLANYRL